MARFVKGIPRLLDYLTPKPRVVGMRFYWMARWRMVRRLGNDRSPSYVWKRRKSSRQERGWLPGRWRLGGLQAPRRVVNPDIRYEPINRLYSEVIKRRRKQGAYPSPYLWGKRFPVSRWR